MLSETGRHGDVSFTFAARRHPHAQGEFGLVKKSIHSLSLINIYDQYEKLFLYAGHHAGYVRFM